MAQRLTGVVDSTYTLDFITKYEVPLYRPRGVRYVQIVCNYREEKEDPYREQLVVGSNRINYPGEVGTPTSYMLTV